MSNTPDNDLNLDLHFLPKWAQQSPDINRYSHFTGEEGANERRFRRGDRGPDRGGPQAPGSRPPRSGPRPEGRRPDGPRPEGARREGGGFGRPHGGASGGRPGGGRRDDFRGRGPDRRNEPILPPPLELNATILPDEKGIESLARQIKMSGRAYPLFE
ncbi:MAG: hypothetical protein FJ405_19250, partial [Verrucomicrobia bacterium]|nr:hypothetical protein [Verrucomicrobiota bacterium]